MSIHDLPKRLHVEHLEQGETVVLFLRRHVIVFWRKVVLLFVVACMPIMLWVVFVTQTDWFDDPQSTLRIVLIMLASLFYLFWLRMVFTIWIDYYLDVWIVTNRRIMNIEQAGLFHRKISEQRLDRIQDVSTESKGFLQTTLNFGNIHVQTAAESEHFIFHDIANPEDVAREISQLQDVALDRSGGKKESEESPSQEKPVQEPPHQAS